MVNVIDAIKRGCAKRTQAVLGNIDGSDVGVRMCSFGLHRSCATFIVIDPPLILMPAIGAPLTSPYFIGMRLVPVSNGIFPPVISSFRLFALLLSDALKVSAAICVRFGSYAFRVSRTFRAR